jgi:hypothetical protein
MGVGGTPEGNRQHASIRVSFGLESNDVLAGGVDVHELS